MYCRPDTRVANALEAEDIVTRPDAALPAQATKCHLLLAIVTTDRTPSTTRRNSAYRYDSESVKIQEVLKDAEVKLSDSND
jgi:hypothetical protein